MESAEKHRRAVPIDTGWAWVVMVGSFGVHFMTIGYVRSFGLLFVAFQSKFGSNSAATAAVSGVQYITYSLTTLLVVNVLMRHLTVRTICVAGSLLEAFSLCASSLVTSVSYLVITQGVAFGAGHACLFCPTLVMISEHFEKRRPIATILATCGVGVGGILFPLVCRYLINEYGLSGALLLVSGLLLQQVVFVSLFTPFAKYPLVRKMGLQSSSRSDNESKDHNELYTSADTNGHCDEIMLSNDLNCSSPSSTVESKSTALTNWKSESASDIDLYRDDHAEKTDHLIQKSKSDESDSEQHSQLCIQDVNDSKLSKLEGSQSGMLTSLIAVSTTDIYSSAMNLREKCDDQLGSNDEGNKPQQTSRKCPPTIPAHARTLAYWLVAVFFIGAGVASMLPVIFLPPLAEERGASKDDGAMMLLVSAITDLIGRLFLGLVLQCGRSRSPTFTLIVPLGLCGVLYLFTPLVRGLTLLYLFSAASGALTSTFWAAQSLVVIEILGLKNLGPALGFYSIIVGLGSGVSFPLAGALRDSSGSYSSSYFYFGALYLIAVTALIVLQFKCVRVRSGTDSDVIELQT